MELVLEGSTAHTTANFSKANFYYDGWNNWGTDRYGNVEWGGGSCKSWSVSSYNPDFPYSGDCEVGRTLKGFSKDLTGEPMYDMYNTYYGSTTYADDFVMAAIDGTTEAKSGVDFGTLTDTQRIELLMKGAVYMNTWMYVLHEYESAIVKCEAGSLDDDSGAPHAWDEGWAFYAGSEQSQGESDGWLTYTLAEKRCADFGTCDTEVNITNGVQDLAQANRMHLAHATSGLAHIRAGECTEANDDLTEIKKWMTVPLIQGTLKYAYKCDPLGGGTGDTAKACAEGYAFAAAVLPQIDNANANSGTTVLDNMKIGANVPDGYAAVKSALEATYVSLGISCDDIGAYSPMEACDDATLASGAATHGPAIAKAAAVFAMVMLYLA